MKYIVAEITRNWPGEGPLIQSLFEDVIEANLQRSYELHSFSQSSVVVSPGTLRETIIAVIQFKSP